MSTVQVLEQPEERVPGGKTSSTVALEKLAVKYCTKRGGGPRTSVQVGLHLVVTLPLSAAPNPVFLRAGQAAGFALVWEAHVHSRGKLTLPL